MKMISSTRTTSTNGVTLISAIGARPRDRLPPDSEAGVNAIALASETPPDQVHELERKVVHTRAHLFERIAEVVVEDRRRDSGEETDGGRDQCFRDAGSDGFQTGAPRGAQILERADDPNDCTQQTNK